MIKVITLGFFIKGKLSDTINFGIFLDQFAANIA